MQSQIPDGFPDWNPSASHCAPSTRTACHVLYHFTPGVASRAPFGYERTDGTARSALNQLSSTAEVPIGSPGSTGSRWRLNLESMGCGPPCGTGAVTGTPSYWQQGQGQPITYGSTIMPGMWTFDGTFSPQVRWDPDQAGRGREPRFKHPASTVVGRQCQRVALDTLQAENGNLPRCTPMGLNTLRTAWSVTL